MGFVLFFALTGVVLAEQASAFSETSPTGGATGLQPQGLNHAGIYQLRQLDPNLTGAGVKCAVICRSITYVDGEPQNDYRPAEDHNCFANTQYIFHDQQYLPAGVSAHSTAICSILFGRDPNAYNEGLGDFIYEGAAPEAQPEIYEFWHFLINNVFPFSAPDANIITADIGYQFEDWWTRGFEAMAQHYGLTVVIGIGNGYNSSDPPLYPGAGSNIIGVGVVKSVDTNDTAAGLTRFALVYPEYSSRGPTSDGRSKPDIVAPGNCLAAVAGEPNLYEPTGSWSSFATPIVAGTAALLVQQTSLDPNLQLATSREGGNCVIKAVLLNSATKLPYWHKGLLTKDDDHDVPLDWLQGAGMVNTLAAHGQLSAGRYLPGDCPPAGWDLNKLNLDETPANIYKIRVAEPADPPIGEVSPSADKMISATVVWNKNFAGDYPFEHERDKDADIRLEVWAVDSNEPNNYYLLDFSDSRIDNVEHIYFPADANFTDYEIVISYSNDHDVNQPAISPPYALVWNVAQTPARDDSLWLDLNADGIVDDLDLVALLDNVLASVETPERYLFGDINSDGVLDLNDIQIFFEHLDNTNEQNVEEVKAEDAGPVLPR